VDSSPQRSAYRPAIVFSLTCLAYLVVVGLSFSDVIFTSELNSRSSLSAIETGNVQLPLSRQATWLIMSCILLELYRAGYLLVRSKQISSRFVSILICIAAVLAFIAVPFDSTDVTVYINQGWLQSHYHVNPYNLCVSEIGTWMTDPMLKQHWINSPCIYGPLFAALAGIVTAIGQGKYLLTVYLFKGINLACHLALAWILYEGVSLLSSKSKGLESAYLYGLSPFMLLHLVANVHNDLIMAFFSVFAFYLILKRNFLLLIFSCTAGAAVKYISLLILPGLFVIYWRLTSKTMLITATLLGFIPFAALCLFYWSSIDATHLSLILQYATSHYGSFRSLLQNLATPMIDQGFGAVSLLGYLALSVMLFVSWVQEKEPRALFENVLHDSVLLTAVYVCVVSAHFQAWYVSMFFPLGLMIEKDCALRRFCIFASCTMLFSLMWFGFPNEFYSPLYLWAALILCRLPIKLSDDTNLQAVAEGVQDPFSAPLASSDTLMPAEGIVADSHLAAPAAKTEASEPSAPALSEPDS